MAGFVGCVIVQWRALRGAPLAWAAVGLTVLVTQVGFWYEVGLGGTSFDPTDPARVFSIGVSVVAFLVPLLAVVLMGGAQRDGWRRGRPAGLLAARLLVVIVALASIPLVAFVALLPAMAAASVVWPWAEIADPRWQPWLPLPGLLARALWTAVPYATLCALLTVLTRSRVTGTVLAAVDAVLENLLVDLTVGWFESLDWVFGLLPWQMYYNWLSDPDTNLGSMHSIAGLSNSLQAFVVLGGHAAWLAAATCLLASRSRPKSTSEPPPPPPRPETRQPAPPSPGRPGTAPRGAVSSGAGPPAAARTAAARPRRAAAALAALAAGVVAVPAALALVLLAARPPTPAKTAYTYVDHHPAEAADALAAAVMAGHPLEQEVARSLGAAISSGFTFLCFDPTGWTPSDNPSTPHCRFTVAIWAPVQISIEGTVTITVSADPQALWPKPTVINLRADSVTST